ncbi:MAG: DNA-processing protein DprA [Gaiellales bacterium]
MSTGKESGPAGSPCLERGSSGYPELLASIYDPPSRLYLRGAGRALLHGPCVALVGARACSPYGRQVARLLGRELAAAGVVVVSGLARGVDAEAHRGALEAGGSTLAVLGCGIDRDYPASHADLARRIAETGLIVSEYPPGVPPAPWQFPARNRIIAGLSRVVVVVEARDRSGALITADFALEEGRDVLAVPGPITSSLSNGTNELLRIGAAPLLSAEDALEALGIEKRVPGRTLDPGYVRILDALADGAFDVDGLVERTGLSAGEIGGALVELELAGHVVSDDGIVRAIAGSRGPSPGAAPTGREHGGLAGARPPPG